MLNANHDATIYRLCKSIPVFVSKFITYSSFSLFCRASVLPDCIRDMILRISQKDNWKGKNCVMCKDSQASQAPSCLAVFLLKCNGSRAVSPEDLLGTQIVSVYKTVEILTFLKYCSQFIHNIIA